MADPIDLSDQQRWVQHASWLDAPEVAIRTNALTCPIHRLNFLLDRQIAALELTFVEEGLIG